MRAPIIVGASVAGASHDRIGLPCQDAFATVVGDDGVVRIAVADGLGSARLSHVGAARAVAAACAHDGEPDGEPDAEAMARAARAALEAAAGEQECDLPDLACTLIASVWTPAGIWTAHVGDGAVVARAEGSLHLVSGPGHGEYLNEVDPLTADDWTERLRTSFLDKPVDAVAIFSDGCERATLRPDGSPHEGFFAPLLAFAEAVTDTESARADLERLLRGAKMSEHSDDDKTLVVGVRAAGP